MEVRSSRRMRTLVTQCSNRGLSANENACALISMMARSKCSNQRPDTLMQDRSPPARRNHLQRAAGPYIGSKRYRAETAASPAGPLCQIADVLLQSNETTLCAKALIAAR